MKYLPIRFFFLVSFLTLGIACSSKNKSDRENVSFEDIDSPVDGSGPGGGDTPYEEVTDVVSEPIAVEENQSIQIEASENQTLVNLVFKTSDAFQEGRYLSEHMLVIKADEESCIKLEVRADVDSLEDVLANVSNSETGEFCRGTEPKVETAEEDDEEDKDEDEGDDESEEGNNEENENNEDDSVALTLMSQTPDLCHQRLFRLKTNEADELGDPFGLEPIVTKTAWLVYKTGNINVWADAEIGNPCFGGVPTSRGKTKLILESVLDTLINYYSLLFPDAQDQIVVEHYKNIGDEAAKIYARLTTLYGPVSDVNANGAVDILISPEINRLMFSDLRTNRHDDFVSGLIVKPEDLDAYDNVSNPESNESEVVYLWAPDPAGLYKYSQYPTANSITSNYQKGYVAQQIMSLIIANARMISRKLQPEKLWLTQGLSLLASAYTAGNDYSFQYLAEYLSTRHHYLSLTDNFDQSMVAEAFKSRHYDATVGYRAMFAWFLHTKLCGQTVEPCARIKELVDTDKHGIENVETVLGQAIDEILAEFGHSVGVEMAFDKDRVRTVLGLPENSTLTHHIMPGLQEVYPSEIPQTYEHDKNADPIAGSADDRAFAGPFPGRDTLFYQTLMPDSNINIRLAKNSVTYVLLTGLLRKETVTTAFIGKNVSVTSIPFGDRNIAQRQIHIEKTSEMAHLDQRPINLSSQIDPQKTYYNPQEYSNSFLVDKNRDLYILGSIDNSDVNLRGSRYTVGDVDSFNIEVDPCKEEADEAACRAEGSRSILLQVIPRDHNKELIPSLLVTQTSLEMFRANKFLNRLKNIDGEVFKDVPETGTVYVGCFSSAVYQDASAPDFTTFDECANGGLTEENYQTEVCDQFTGACVPGMPDQAISFNAYTSAFIKKSQADFVPPLYDNFFHAGPDGFPFFNNWTIRYPDVELDERPGPRPFIQEEIDRQFFEFAYKEDLKAKTYSVHPLFAGIESFENINLDNELEVISDEAILTLETLRLRIADGAAVSEETRDACGALGISATFCADPFTNRVALSSAVNAYTSDKRIVCIIGLSDVEDMDYILNLCPGASFTRTSTINGIPEATESVPEWLKDEQLIIISSSSAGSYRTYYKPIFPVVKKTESYCLGNAEKDLNGFAGTDYPPCLIENSEGEGGDIRTQLNMPATQFSSSDWCGGVFEENFLACADHYSYYISAHSNEKRKLVPTLNYKRFTGQRTRSFLPFSIARSAGEYIGKQEQLHHVRFNVSTASSTIIHVMVGGLKKSQGKYLLRVKTKDFEEVITP
ncbi:MAG: hypothetical protein AB8G05_19920 [Oligoflexales bacterium]